ncbi:hypothetical protein BU24DRAFT_478108 [Aaosphaeria arxii CBS 175.79]|uniref:Uncharacterized protein n=1 Tax=Aaosphaeria arxii CBS 175.79 TaxID=1450172 RepID=A0A6A5XVV1_9PLEO|nr:uncharacterized protein BU24DRAFT_478108 [Aaosphaeria arxii CBS 175.79]KAF2017089.1 hypothetical protein BU24DRAFT_478108 [Aaosphaeria arxii CBS 175.79]
MSDTRVPPNPLPSLVGKKTSRADFEELDSHADEDQPEKEPDLEQPAKKKKKRRGKPRNGSAAERRFKREYREYKKQPAATASEGDGNPPLVINPMLQFLQALTGKYPICFYMLSYDTLAYMPCFSYTRKQQCIIALCVDRNTDTVNRTPFYLEHSDGVEPVLVEHPDNCYLSQFINNKSKHRC